MKYSLMSILFLSTFSIMANTLNGGDSLQQECTNPIVITIKTETLCPLNQGSLVIENITGGNPDPINGYLVGINPTFIPIFQFFPGQPPAVFALPPGTYAVSASDSRGCASNVIVEICPCVTVAFTVEPARPCKKDGKIIVTGITEVVGSGSFLVNVDGKKPSKTFDPTNPQQQPLVFSHLSAGVHTINVTDSTFASCVSKTQVVVGRSKVKK